eukprot:3090878-Amphidinium_carterae.1
MEHNALRTSAGTTCILMTGVRMWDDSNPLRTPAHKQVHFGIGAFLARTPTKALLQNGQSKCMNGPC